MLDGYFSDICYSCDFRPYDLKPILVDRRLKYSLIQILFDWFGAEVTNFVDDFPTLNKEDWIIIYEQLSWLYLFKVIERLWQNLDEIEL